MDKAKKKLLQLLNGKRILIIENDFTLSGAVGAFATFCRENKLELNTLFECEELSLKYIKEQVAWFDVIAFETQWVTDNSKEIGKMIAVLTKKKIIIECYVHEATWNFKPKGIVHDVYVLDSYEEAEEWEIKKLTFRK